MRPLSERESGAPYTKAEYAARQRVSEKTINRLLKAGLPHLRVGNLIRIEPTTADAWLAERRPAPRRRSAIPANGGASPAKSRNFTSRDTTIDELADSLRRSPRARVMARGLPVQEVVSLFFAERAGETGSR